jgi:hypothetical protein
MISLILVLLVSGVSAVHLGSPRVAHLAASAQLSALLQQQYLFESSINALVSNLTAIQTQLNATANASVKVTILEQAITTERQKIAVLQQAIVPPFNLSSTSCLQLTPTQKNTLTVQLNSTQAELLKLQQMASGMPNNSMLVQLQADILNQEAVVASLSQVIHANCSSTSALIPSVFQSNLYATNWILGRQSIANLVDQYFQRSQMYKTVSNCPLNTPFFNGTSCITCNGSVFNM